MGIWGVKGHQLVAVGLCFPLLSAACFFTAVALRQSFPTLTVVPTWPEARAVGLTSQEVL